MNKISPKQITLIHTAKSRLGISEDNYRSLLASHNAQSSKDLTADQATAVIATLAKMGFKTAQHTRTGQARISGRQMHLVAKMWNEHPAVYAKTEEALNSFCKRITGVDKVAWLTAKQCSKLIKAIENLK
ncbi:MAG: regulatory protein GemA [Ignavibacteriaceae bacterium]|nr:regulatory protein GemA [Ignavibacteriaceae bacterium]